MDVHIITFHEQPLGEVLLSLYSLITSVLKSLLTGIQYFTFDALDAMLEHATELNTIRDSVQVHTRTIPEIAERLYRQRVATH